MAISIFPTGTPYLLSDGTGTLDQLSLGIAVCGAHLEGPCLLHQEDTAMTQVLHTCANLESDLRRQSQKGGRSVRDPAIQACPRWKISLVPSGSPARKIPFYLEPCLVR